MQWKKTRLTINRWEAFNFRITETIDIDGRPFTLQSTASDEEPAPFSTLAEAQGHASLLNDLAITKANNDALRAELAALRNGHSPDTTLVAATRQPANMERPTATIDLPLPEDFGLQSDGAPWPDEIDPSLPAADDGRGIPKPASVDSADVDAIASRLLTVMARNNGHAPRIFAGAND